MLRPGEAGTEDRDVQVTLGHVVCAAPRRRSGISSSARNRGRGADDGDVRAHRPSPEDTSPKDGLDHSACTTVGLVACHSHSSGQRRSSPWPLVTFQQPLPLTVVGRGSVRAATRSVSGRRKLRRTDRTFRARRRRQLGPIRQMKLRLKKQEASPEAAAPAPQADAAAVADDTGEHTPRRRPKTSRRDSRGDVAPGDVAGRSPRGDLDAAGGERRAERGGRSRAAADRAQRAPSRGAARVPRCAHERDAAAGVVGADQLRTSPR